MILLTWRKILAEISQMEKTQRSCASSGQFYHEEKA